MSGAPTPPVLPEAFAAQAAPGFINTIPDTTVDPQRASYELGFPPNVMTPIPSGGKPMLGPDMNGILFAISSHTVYQQTGQPYRYNSMVATEISGYAVGTILGRADGTGLWMNIVDGNTTDPDASGAGWVTIASYGHQPVATTGGIVTLTALQASRYVIVISGVLAANLQLVLPSQLRSWLIVNTTSGAFTTTVRTAGGSGVVVPQGGFGAPVEVYGDGTNLYPTVAPLTIPTSVPAVPNTYVLRDNLGNVYAAHLFTTTNISNVTLSAVFVESGSDGRILKTDLANLAAQLFLQGIGGAVTDGQVPESAVTQFTAAILANAALTGAPTAPTPSAGDNSTRVATTAFAGGTLTTNANGVAWRSPIGFTIQAGFAQSAGVSTVVTFPVPFTTAFYGGVCSTANRTGGGSNGTNFVNSGGLSQMTCLFDVQQTGPGTGQHGGYWIAVGI